MSGLSPSVQCRSDLTGAIITGADFSNALLDKPQQMVSHTAMDVHWPECFAVAVV